MIEKSLVLYGMFLGKNPTHLFHFVSTSLPYGPPAPSDSGRSPVSGQSTLPDSCAPVSFAEQLGAAKRSEATGHRGAAGIDVRKFHCKRCQN